MSDHNTGHHAGHSDDGDGNEPAHGISHGPGHEMDVPPTKELFNIVWGLGALTLLSLATCVQLFNNQQRDIMTERGNESSQVLMQYRKDMEVATRTAGETTIKDAGGAEIKQRYMPLKAARDIVLSKPEEMKAAAPPRGWMHPDDIAAGAQAGGAPAGGAVQAPPDAGSAPGAGPGAGQRPGQWQQEQEGVTDEGAAEHAPVAHRHPRSRQAPAPDRRSADGPAVPGGAAVSGGPVVSGGAAVPDGPAEEVGSPPAGSRPCRDRPAGRGLGRGPGRRGATVPARVRGSAYGRSFLPDVQVIHFLGCLPIRRQSPQSD